MRSTVSVKGQVVIPQALRQRLGIRAGTMLDMREVNGQLVATKVDAHDAVGRVFGRFLAAPGEPATTDDWIGELRDRERPA